MLLTTIDPPEKKWNKIYLEVQKLIQQVTKLLRIDKIGQYLKTNGLLLATLEKKLTFHLGTQ